MGNFSKFVLNKILGWRVVNNQPEVPKCVLAVAPTPVTGIVVGKLAYSSWVVSQFLIKAEWFFPFNLFKALAGFREKRTQRSVDGCICRRV